MIKDVDNSDYVDGLVDSERFVLYLENENRLITGMEDYVMTAVKYV